MHILHVVGARPNFMKVAPVMAALGARGARQTLIHTGQHYDARLSDEIFRELGLPKPDINLGVGSGSHAEQTGQVLVGVERAILERRPGLVLVYGDVNSTVAAALAAVKVGVDVGHVEAGLRSGDRTMPEEINRIVTDRLATWLFTPSGDADANLEAEGVPAAWVHRVGNVMIDSLVRVLPHANPDRILRSLSLKNGNGAVPFVLVTLHRPSNVDDDDALRPLLAALGEIARDVPVVFPIHPRTKARVEAAAIPHLRISVIAPLGYIDFLALERHAALVITDSGGVQEETTYLGVPCLTVRENTERPVTCIIGTNTVIGRDTDRLKAETLRILSGTSRKGTVPPLWDGRAAVRIADTLLR